jgi:AcrR family transcriptional regulator
MRLRPARGYSPPLKLCSRKMRYAQAGIREIAKEADVATSLLLRYFGSKAALFEEALLNAMYAQGVFERDKVRFGEHMAQLLVTDGDTNLSGMIVHSSGDAEAKEITAMVTKTYAIEGLARWLGPPMRMPVL